LTTGRCEQIGSWDETQKHIAMEKEERKREGWSGSGQGSSPRAQGTARKIRKEDGEGLAIIRRTSDRRGKNVYERGTRDKTRSLQKTDVGRSDGRASQLSDPETSFKPWKLAQRKGKSGAMRKGRSSCQPHAAPSVGNVQKTHDAHRRSRYRRGRTGCLAGSPRGRQSWQGGGLVQTGGGAKKSRLGDFYPPY